MVIEAFVRGSEVHLTVVWLSDGTVGRYLIPITEWPATREAFKKLAGVDIPALIEGKFEKAEQYAVKPSEMN